MRSHNLLGFTSNNQRPLPSRPKKPVPLEEHFTMKYFRLITATIVAVLSFLGAAQTINSACAPSGTHLRTGTEACHCNSDGSVTCDAFTLCGVGNINANANLISTYTATVQCRNKGGQIVDVKTQPITIPVPISNLRSRNGCLAVPSPPTRLWRWPGR